MSSFCISCQKHTSSLDSENLKAVNGTNYLRSKCAQCGKSKSLFLKKGAGVFNKLLNKLPFPEIHLKLPKDVESEQVPGGDFNHTGKYSFCGPFTKLDKRLQQGYQGVNNLDRACLQHDLAYSQHSDTKSRNVADDILTKAAINIATDPNTPDYERQQARTVSAIMATKSRLGFGAKEAPDDFSSFLAKELHKGARRKFPRRKVQVFGVDEIWAADLVDMQDFAKENGGFRYMLTIIDVMSKFAWAIPLKDKTGKSVAAAFEKVLNSSDRKPIKLWVDKGTEFYNKTMDNFLKANHIDRYSTESEFKASVVERFNRTLKSIMWKYFTTKNTFNYMNILDELLRKYNDTKHRTIGMTPTEASMLENEAELLRKYPKTVRFRGKTKFKPGDKVRITKHKTVFEKGYWPNWTEEVFVISEVRPTMPVTYKIKDLQDDPVTGSFYEEELQKANQEIYRIEKVIRKRTKNGRREIFVKWRGYSDKFNQWISESDVENL